MEIRRRALLKVTLAAPYPGTELYRQAKENKWFAGDAHLVDELGQQAAALEYESLTCEEIFRSVERFYKAYYFRPRPIARMVGEMLGDWDMMKRRLREGVEFFRFLRAHEA